MHPGQLPLLHTQTPGKMEQGDTSIAGPIFEGISFAVIPSESLPPHTAAQITEALEINGGKHIRLRDTDHQIDDLSSVTHIISDDIHFPQYREAIERGVLVVKKSWVGQSIGKRKVSGARQHSPDPSQYFQDVVVTFGELPDGDCDAIIGGVIALGGQYQPVFTKLTTHCVTTDENHPKCQIGRQRNPNAIIVLPHWFDDCLRLGKKISERPYSFPHPPIMQKDLLRPANSEAPGVEGATTAVPTGSLMQTPPSSPSQSRKNLNAFMSKKVKLSSDLGIHAHLRQTLEELIIHGGGTITKDINQANIYIGQYRDGTDYVTAARAKKEVANLSWLYCVINENRYFNPLAKMLHYPIPRDGIPGFQNMKISISNYNGDARIYLENLIRYCGAEFTRTMKQDNTHLICAHTKSEKYEAAQEWNINVVNSMWIEESYAKCTVQSLSNPKYSHFPISTNLTEVVGQTPLDMRKIEQMFYPPTCDPAPRNTQASPTKTQIKTSIPPSSVTMGGMTPHKVSSFAAPALIAEGDESVEEEVEVGHERSTRRGLDRPPKQSLNAEDEQVSTPSAAPRPRGRPRKTASTPNHLDDEKENESPVAFTTSGRAAKHKANDLLHNVIAPDMDLYDREKKRKGGVLHGSSRRSGEDFSSAVAQRPKKRKSDEATYDAKAEGSDLSDGETQPAGNDAKKAKTAASAAPAYKLPEIRYRMILTGDDRWIGKSKQYDTDRTKLRVLGIQLIEDPANCNLLIVPNIKRTKKFVCAIANAPVVVDTSYLDYALQNDALMEGARVLSDPEAEAKYDFKLSEALDRAKANAHRLLAGWHIFVTKDVQGGFETYKDIINTNGGAPYLYAGRTGMQIARPPNPREGEEAKEVFLVSGEGEAERKLWKTFRALAGKQGLKPKVVKTEWLLTCCLVQELRWEEGWEWGAEDV